MISSPIPKKNDQQTVVSSWTFLHPTGGDSVVVSALRTAAGSTTTTTTSSSSSSSSSTVPENHTTSQQQPKPKKITKKRLLPLWSEIPDPDSYTYDSYLRDIPDKLIASEREYQLRKSIFDTHWASIRAHNMMAADLFSKDKSDNSSSGGTRSSSGFHTHHRLGLNLFMDRFEHELPRPGYDKRQHPAWNQNPIDDSVRTVSDASSTGATTATTGGNGRRTGRREVRTALYIRVFQFYQEFHFLNVF